MIITWILISGITLIILNQISHIEKVVALNDAQLTLANDFEKIKDTFNLSIDNLKTIVLISAFIYPVILLLFNEYQNLVIFKAYKIIFEKKLYYDLSIYKSVIFISVIIIMFLLPWTLYIFGNKVSNSQNLKVVGKNLEKYNFTDVESLVVNDPMTYLNNFKFEKLEYLGVRGKCSSLENLKKIAPHLQKISIPYSSIKSMSYLFKNAPTNLVVDVYSDVEKSKIPLFIKTNGDTVFSYDNSIELDWMNHYYSDVIMKLPPFSGPINRCKFLKRVELGTEDFHPNVLKYFDSLEWLKLNGTKTSIIWYQTLLKVLNTSLSNLKTLSLHETGRKFGNMGYVSGKGNIIDSLGVFIDKLYGDITLEDLGFKLSENDSSLNSNYNMMSDFGLRVKEIKTDCQAYKEGLRENDLIFHIEKGSDLSVFHFTKSIEEFKEFVSLHKRGEYLRIGILTIDGIKFIDILIE